jgi:hypothetical protein
MSDLQFERAVSDWLEDGSDRTPRRAIEGVLLAVKTTPQERDLRIPWRFPRMPALTRATGIAAVALVATVSAGGLIYLNSNGGPGGKPTPSPAGSAPQTAAPTSASTPRPTQPAWLPDDPAFWTSYTSEIYGFTVSIPAGWSISDPADVPWEPGLPTTESTNWADTFINDSATDGDDIALSFWQMPAPTGADLGSWEGLQAAYLEQCTSNASPGASSCTVASPPIPLCVGAQECKPAMILVLGTDAEASPDGFYGDPETGLITTFSSWRYDSFPAAARYGGMIALVKDLLAQVVDIRDPSPSETPH